MIIGICSGSRAIAPIRMGSGLSFHSRTMFTLAGNTADEQRHRGQRAELAGLAEPAAARRSPTSATPEA